MNMLLAVASQRDGQAFNNNFMMGKIKLFLIYECISILGSIIFYEISY